MMQVKPMLHRFWQGAFSCLILVAATSALSAADSSKIGKVELKSAGPITFGTDGVLFIGDAQAATIIAVATKDTVESKSAPFDIEKIDTKIAGLLGIKAEDVRIADLAVNPISKQIYLSVARGKGMNAEALILKVSPQGAISEFSLKEVQYSVAPIANAVTGNKRLEAITGLKFIKDKIYVSGLSNEEFASTLRSISYPFEGKSVASAIQIYHGAHGKFETAAPVRTFTALEVGGKEEILAAYTCTPLVRIPVEQLQDKAKVTGKTVAELGNRNRPLDMFVYQKEGKQFVLMANSSRGVMKVSLEELDKVEAITQKIQNTAGLKYNTIETLKGVEQLERLDETHAVILSKSADGYTLRSIELP